MICNNCGTENLDDMLYCKKCGAIRRNKAAKDYNMDLLIDLSSKQI